MITVAENPTSNNRLQDIANFISSIGGTIVRTATGVRGSVSATPTTVTSTIQTTPSPVSQAEKPSLAFIAIGVGLIILAIIAGILFSK